MTSTKIPDEFISIIQVINEDENLKDWLRGLENLPDNLRFMELHKIGLKMRKKNEDKAFVRFMESLKNKSFYNAVLETIKKSEDEKDTSKLLSFFKGFFE